MERKKVGEVWVNLSKNGKKYVKGDVFGKKVIGFPKVTSKGVVYELFESEVQMKIEGDL